MTKAKIDRNNLIVKLKDETELPFKTIATMIGKKISVSRIARIYKREKAKLK